MKRITALFRLLLLIALAAGLYSSGNVSLARESGHHEAIEWVALAELPSEVRQTLHLIQIGGPFPYPHKNGSTFGNFEKRLPARARGYYRECTVPTPRRRDRCARRIISGKMPAEAASAFGEYYYTDDHYRSFREP